MAVGETSTNADWQSCVKETEEDENEEGQDNEEGEGEFT